MINKVNLKNQIVPFVEFLANQKTIQENYFVFKNATYTKKSLRERERERETETEELKKIGISEL